MPVHNAEVAAIFDELADLLEIQGANEFRVRAYRSAARNINSLPHSVSEMVARDEDLSKLPGIGKDLARKIEEIVRSGKLKKLEEIKTEVPADITIPYRGFALEIIDAPGYHVVEVTLGNLRIRPPRIYRSI